MRRPLAGVLGFSFAGLLVGSCGSAPPPAPERAETFDERFVLVDWLGQGRLYVAKATAADEGLLRVRYADGTEAWAERARVREERIAGGDPVTVLLRDSIPPWGGVVQERRGDRLLVRFDAGGTAWVDLERVEAIGFPPELSDRRSAGASPQGPQTAADAPALDPAHLVPGATLTAVWTGSVFAGVILERREDLLKVRWDGDGTVGWISVEYVRDVWPPPDPSALRAGARVRARSEEGEAQDAVVLSRRRNQIRVRWVQDGTESELRSDAVLRIHPRAAQDALREGTKVRVGWLGDEFDAEILERRDDLVHIRWEADGGEAWIEAADVREIVTP